MCHNRLIADVTLHIYGGFVTLKWLLDCQFRARDMTETNGDIHGGSPHCPHIGPLTVHNYCTTRPNEALLFPLVIKGRKMPGDDLLWRPSFLLYYCLNCWLLVISSLCAWLFVSGCYYNFRCVCLPRFPSLALVQISRHSFSPVFCRTFAVTILFFSFFYGLSKQLPLFPLVAATMDCEVVCLSR